MQLLLFLLSLGLWTTIVALHFRKLPEMILIWAAIGFFFYAGFIFAALDGTPYSETTLTEALWFSIAFNSSYIIFLTFISALLPRFLTSPHLITGGARRFARNASRDWQRFTNLILFILLALVALTSFLLMRETGSPFGQNWRDNKEIEGYIFLQNTYFAVACAPYLLFLAKRRLYAICAAGLCFIFVIQFQSRSLLLPAAMPFVIHYIFVNRKILKGLVGSVLFVLIAFAVQQLRYVFSDLEVNTESVSAIFSNAATTIGEGGGDLSIIETFFFVIERGHLINGEGEGRTFLRLLFFFLPSGGLKPPDFTYEIWNAVTGLYGMGGSLHPTLYGAYYADLGWPSLVLIFILFVPFLLLRTFSVYFRMEYIQFIGPLSMGAVLVARGSLYNGIVAMIVPILLLIIIRTASRFRSRKNAEWTHSASA